MNQRLSGLEGGARDRSGMNDNRPKLLKLLTDASIGVILVEHQDRLSSFGANYVEQLLQMQGRI